MGRNLFVIVFAIFTVALSIGVTGLWSSGADLLVCLSTSVVLAGSIVTLIATGVRR